MISSAQNPIISAAFARAKVAMLTLVVLAFMGLGTYQTAPREADPDIPLPFVSVVLPLPGVSPEDAERLLARPAEAELQSLDGLVQMDSTAYENAAQFRLEFDAGYDMNQAVIDVREAIDRAKSEFPADAEEPLIEELNAQSLLPTISVILYGSAPERTLFDEAKRLEDRIRSLPGVKDITMVGAREEVVNIEVSAAVLDNYNLSPDRLGALIRENNVLVPAGRIRFEDGSYSVKVPGLVKSLEDMAAIPVSASPTGLVTLGDIADIRRTFEDAEGYARFDGERAIGLDVSKRGDANLLELTAGVKDVTEALAETWPSTIHYSFVGDQSVQVDSIFGSLTASIGIAIILVMIVVVAALGLRSSLLVGIAIPSSFLLGLALIGFMGFTLNNMVMFSMVLAVGMLVDAAIVVVELADRRMAEGLPRRAAFYEASVRMFWPITASTATTLAAFVPFLFWNDLEGYFMRWLPITLILVLSSSLVVALIFLPIIGASFGVPEWAKKKFGLKGQTEGRERSDLDTVDPTELPGFTGTYARAVNFLAYRPILVLIGAALVIMMCSKMFRLAEVEVEQFLRVDNEEVQVLVQARGNISETAILEVAETVKERIGEHPAIEHIYLQTGPQLARTPDVAPDTVAYLRIDLVPFGERIRSGEVVELVRARTQGIPGVHLEVREPEQGPPVGKDVQVEIYADDVEEANAAASLLRQFMEQDQIVLDGREIKTFMDIEDTKVLPAIEWQLEVDRGEAGRYGLGVDDVGRAIRVATEGLIVDTYRPDDADEELNIRIRYPAEERTLDRLTAIDVVTPQGPVPLSTFTTRSAQEHIDKVVRRNGRRIVIVQANGNSTVPGYLVSPDKATAAARRFLESGALEEQISPDVTTRLRGASEEAQESATFFAGAMVAAMTMIGVILLLQFNSFYHAALTLSSVVLAVYGVLAGIAISGQYISVIMTGVGIVALAGIVVNNNIVLIDTFHALRKTGYSVHESAVRTATQRMRPVLLTTFTTIIGLLPMVLELDIDFKNARVGIGNATSSWWVLLSSAIVYGLAFSTLLTLVLTPVLLAAPEQLGKRFKHYGAQVPHYMGRLRKMRDSARPSPSSAQSGEGQQRPSLPEAAE